MISIDGSQGEGGGQIVRSALALSLLTGEAMTIENMRAKRKKPGLRQQHLTAVTMAAAVGGSTVDGATIGARRPVFKPSRVTPGDYRFDVGTAGSATLALQTVLPALLVASGPSTLKLAGGTHNWPWPRTRAAAGHFARWRFPVTRRRISAYYGVISAFRSMLPRPPVIKCWSGWQKAEPLLRCRPNHHRSAVHQASS